MSDSSFFGLAADLCMGSILDGHARRQRFLGALADQVAKAEEARLDPPEVSPDLDDCPKCDGGIISTRLPQEGPAVYLYQVCETCDGTGRVDGYEMSHPCNCPEDRCVC